MTRRIVLALFLLIAPLALLAESDDRDVLLTPDGILYTIESDFVENYGIDSPSSHVLKFTIQQEGKTSSSFVPASLTGGYHSEPALAYEAETNTLFALWQNMPNRLGSELVFATYREGAWSEPSSIASAPFRFRKNLRIGVTRYVEEIQQDETAVKKRSTVIHAAWWEDSSEGQSARYAILAIENGTVQSSQVHELMRFVQPSGAAFEFDPNSVGILTQPLVFELPGSTAVDVIFGDLNTNRLYRVEVRPIRGDATITVPIGVSRGEYPPPRMVSNSSKMSGINGPGGSTLILYYKADGKLRYTMFGRRGWSDVKSISLNDSITTYDAMTALQKLAASD